MNAPQDGRTRLDYTQVKNLYEAGLADADIAKAVGCAAITIWRWRGSHGLHSNAVGCGKFQYRYNHEKIQELYKAGHTDKVISERIGCTVSVVHKWRKKRGYPPNKRAGR